MKRIFLMGVTLTLLLGIPAKAQEQKFSVEIASAAQAVVEPVTYSYSGQEYPCIWLPVKPVSREGREVIGPNMDVAGPRSFYVIVRNIANGPVKLWVLRSTLYESIAFTIVIGDKTFHVTHRADGWDSNFPWPWYFPVNGVKVVPIDFTVGYWDGLPSSTEGGNKIWKTTATFNYQQEPPEDLKGVDRMHLPTHSFSSSETDVVGQVMRPG